ncbi:type 1 glutamine amidotransferase domain-containing protein [Salinisphaera sp. T31B1]|uniref:type 1 glutamine amidotransferase domain-containing protein n=1 Tax=Salinisphaera sp. T31B1 TaxID=727963 RepID=UPI00333F42DC
MTSELYGLNIAVLIAGGFEHVEYLLPRRHLESTGAKVTVVSSSRRPVRSWDVNDWGEAVAVDVPLATADSNDYHALVLPGGLMNADALRTEQAALAFIRAFFDNDKPVATIRHGAWPLIDADVVRGRRLTSWPSLRRDLENAGAYWMDESVVVDAGLVSTRWPSDLADFNRVMIRTLARAPLTGNAISTGLSRADPVCLTHRSPQ